VRSSLFGLLPVGRLQVQESAVIPIVSCFCEFPLKQVTLVPTYSFPLTVVPIRSALCQRLY